jgi:hypothetical protein
LPIHPQEELAKFSKEVEFGEFDLLTIGGKDLSPCCLREREHGIRCLVFFLKDTD